MSLSAQFGKSVQVQHMERRAPFEDTVSGCVLASLLNHSLSLYVELEKTHWHLRLNQAGHAPNAEPDGPVEIAGEVCTISLRLIASVSRLQRVLDPNLSPECAAFLAAVQEKLAEICELAGEKHDVPRSKMQFLHSKGHESLKADSLHQAEREQRDVPARHFEM
jgi:hypothetical protein